MKTKLITQLIVTVVTLSLSIKASERNNHQLLSVFNVLHEIAQARINNKIDTTPPTQYINYQDNPCTDIVIAMSQCSKTFYEKTENYRFQLLHEKFYEKIISIIGPHHNLSSGLLSNIMSKKERKSFLKFIKLFKSKINNSNAFNTHSVEKSLYVILLALKKPICFLSSSQFDAHKFEIMVYDEIESITIDLLSMLADNRCTIKLPIFFVNIPEANKRLAGHNLQLTLVNENNINTRKLLYLIRDASNYPFRINGNAMFPTEIQHKSPYFTYQENKNSHEAEFLFNDGITKNILESINNRKNPWFNLPRITVKEIGDKRKDRYCILKEHIGLEIIKDDYTEAEISYIRQDNEPDESAIY